MIKVLGQVIAEVKAEVEGVKIAKEAEQIRIVNLEAESQESVEIQLADQNHIATAGLPGLVGVVGTITEVQVTKMGIILKLIIYTSKTSQTTLLKTTLHICLSNSDTSNPRL